MEYDRLTEAARDRDDGDDPVPHPCAMNPQPTREFRPHGLWFRAVPEFDPQRPLADLRDWRARAMAGPVELSGRWRGEHARLLWSPEKSHARGSAA